MGGKSLEKINEIIKNTKGNLPQNLREAVIHEIGHAKVFYGRSANPLSKEIKRVTDEHLKIYKGGGTI